MLNGDNVKFSDFFEKEDPAYEVFNISLETVFDKDDGCTEYIDRLSQEARLVYLLWCFDGEVHNGGFDQLFTNSLGNHCLEILNGLYRIQANISHDLLKKAISWFPDALPSEDRQERWAQHEKFCENIEYETESESLDQEFYQYKDNLTLLINKFVKSNPNAKIKA